jgi:leader peptidase (prepilin peptidase)/N-methyltransferase
VNTVRETVIFFFLFGTVFGSFINVVILRIPAGESVVTVPSHCPSCKKKLKWYELLPILSYIFLRGRCSGCKVSVSAQYPIVEAVNGALWVLVALFFENPPHIQIFGCLAASALLAIAVIDARTMEIPPPLNISILVLGAARLAFDYQNWLLYTIGFVSVSGFLLLLFILSGGRAIGGGDIKLMAACGLFLGWQLIILAFFTGALLGSVVHITRMIVKKAGRTLAFGPYLAAGVFISLLWGNVFLDWYLRFL